MLWLPRQVLFDPERGHHVLPGNALLPAHHGMLITRALQEWACLLSLELSFETAARLLGLDHPRSHPPLLLGTSAPRPPARGSDPHGGSPGSEALTPPARYRVPGVDAPQLVPAHPVRRPAAWPPALQAAVTTALAQDQPTPPAGVSAADWERVLSVRRAEPKSDPATLARLGPAVAPNQVVVAVDGVLVRQPRGHQFWELRTARVTTATGSRYLSGTGEVFLRQLFVCLRLCAGRRRPVTFLGDGAAWLRQFYEEQVAPWCRCECILDWYHLAKKVRGFASQIVRDRKARRALTGAALRRLWEGDVAGAVAALEAYRPGARNEAKLEELAAYLEARTELLPNYRERRRQQQYLGSGAVEKANDLLVARRQKHHGMHWSEAMSDALAALQTLRLNGGWDLYWRERRVLPLVAT